MLIDEIDKADIEFPNDLLRELDRMEFFVYETRQLVKAKNRPVIIITSNNEKELPDAFLRRCFFHYIRFPDADTMKQIVDVHYPGLAGHPQHQLARTQQSGFGGMISFDLGSLEKARSFCDAVEVFTLAESLGGVESLVCHPATMTHAALPADERERLGIGDGLVRLSVGIEDSRDLLAELEYALG